MEKQVNRIYELFDQRRKIESAQAVIWLEELKDWKKDKEEMKNTIHIKIQGLSI